MTSAYESGDEPDILVQHRLRIAREYAGLDQGELADRIGISRNTVGNAENGNVRPRKITINAWALACGVRASWIEHGPGGRPGNPPASPSRENGSSKPGPNFPNGCFVREYPRSSALIRVACA